LAGKGPAEESLRQESHQKVDAVVQRIGQERTDLGTRVDTEVANSPAGEGMRRAKDAAGRVQQEVAHRSAGHTVAVHSLVGLITEWELDHNHLPQEERLRVGRQLLPGMAQILQLEAGQM
jgi:hypothetical protein